MAGPGLLLVKFGVKLALIGQSYRRLHVDKFIAFLVFQKFEYQWSLSIVSGWDVITTIRGPGRRSRDASRDCLCPARG